VFLVFFALPIYLAHTADLKLPQSCSVWGAFLRRTRGGAGRDNSVRRSGRVGSGGATCNLSQALGCVDRGYQCFDNPAPCLAQRSSPRAWQMASQARLWSAPGRWSPAGCASPVDVGGTISDSYELPRTKSRRDKPRTGFARLCWHGTAPPAKSDAQHRTPWPRAPVPCRNRLACPAVPRLARSHQPASPQPFAQPRRTLDCFQCRSAHSDRLDPAVHFDANLSRARNTLSQRTQNKRRRRQSLHFCWAPRAYPATICRRPERSSGAVVHIEPVLLRDCGDRYACCPARRKNLGLELFDVASPATALCGSAFFDSVYVSAGAAVLLLRH
jgi:hypothetical protein